MSREVAVLEVRVLPAAQLGIAVSDPSGLRLPGDTSGQPQPAVDLFINHSFNSTTNQFDPASRTGPVGYGDSRTVRFGDFNGDGREDVLSIWNSHFYVSFNRGNGQFDLPITFGAVPQNSSYLGQDQSQSTPPSPSLGVQEGIYIARFNGDLYDDILTIGSDNSLNVSLGSPSGITSQTAWGAMPQGAYSWVILDHNGDGKKDFAYKLHNNTTFGEDWWILTSSGTGFNAGTYTLGGAARGYYNVRVGDFFGNGAEDIVDRFNDTGNKIQDPTTGLLVSYAYWDIIQGVPKGTGQPTSPIYNQANSIRTIEGNWIYGGYVFQDWAWQNVVTGHFMTGNGPATRVEIFARDGYGDLSVLDFLNKSVTSAGNYMGGDLKGIGGPTGDMLSTQNVSVGDVNGDGVDEVIWVENSNSWANGYVSSVYVGFVNLTTHTFNVVQQTNLGWTGGASWALMGNRKIVASGPIW